MMKKLSQKNFFFVSTLVLFFFGSVVFVRADETAPEEAESSEDYLCAQTLLTEASPIIENYEAFAIEYTKVDVPTSEQFDYLLLFYRYVEESIDSIYEASAVVSGFNKTTAFANKELSVCRDTREGLIEYSRRLLPILTSGSTASKTTFEFVDGLKAMNESLVDLSLLFQSTFPVQFIKMDNNFGCYAHQCLSK